ncbi:prephenate dehydrogenase [Frateuria sp. Soil773]|uniref:prephenate dehydrogenase/arogenate dehydrogenase family protein n=1 Tax=Frateuria sp. Soil773 TaxID=1736407 RepID=UPI0006F32715|nr:prephenate dehydrogenase/arogenate dehydrogenase family protein [Frateuria sp. Soil773]KRE89071.1 prephenate dehydrogenase [Frateuria sp. Soil773]
MKTAGPHGSGTFAMLGYGRFGAAFADLLGRAGHRVHAWDPHAEVPAALAAGSMQAAVGAARWIVLAMPVTQVRGAVLALRPLLHGGHVVLDVGSVKVHPCAAMDELLGAAIPHVGSHPLFGPLSLARGEHPRQAVICPAAAHPQAAADAAALFRGLGCEVVVQNPESHDRAMATTHALAFFVAKGLVGIGVDDGLAVAPPSFRGMRHMLAAVRGDAGHLFAAIQRENPFAAQARAQLLAELERVHRRLLADADGDGLAIPGPPA